MRRLPARGLFTRYAVAWVYLLGVSAAEAAYALLPGPGQRALLRWASTNLHNLQHDPAGCLVVSAFFPSGSPQAWPLLISLALFGACRVLGNWRTVAVLAAGHLIGTGVSEGIVAYRVSSGALPGTARHIIDVGPSYVVVAAIAVAILYGGWLARAAALADLALLTFAGGIFEGLSSLEVAAVGHLTALTAGAIAGTLAVWRLRRQAPAAVPSELAGPGTAGPEPGPGSPAAALAPPGADGRDQADRDRADRDRAADQAAQQRPPA